MSGLFYKNLCGFITLAFYVYSGSERLFGGPSLHGEELRSVIVAGSFYLFYSGGITAVSDLDLNYPPNWGIL